MKYLFITALLLNPFIDFHNHAWAQNSNAGTQTEAQIQAKNELNEASRAYREGNFAQAQIHSELALVIDPENRAAPFFIARSIHAQYKPGDQTEENLRKAREAIVAYQRILFRIPNDDEAYKAIAYLYGTLKEDELLRSWVLQRAGNVAIDSQKRVDGYLVLASKDWDCSFKITELPINKRVLIQGNQTIIHYRMPKDPNDFEQANACAKRGLEMINMAIVLDSESDEAWTYKGNILLELEKLAEMVGDMQKEETLHEQVEEARKRVTLLKKMPE